MLDKNGQKILKEDRTKQDLSFNSQNDENERSCENDEIPFE